MDTPPKFDRNPVIQTWIFAELWEVGSNNTKNIEIRKMLSGRPGMRDNSRLAFYVYDQTRSDEVRMQRTAVNKMPFWTLSYAISIAQERIRKAVDTGRWVLQTEPKQLKAS